MKANDVDEANAMDPSIWPKLHGATTHFPIALAICSVACDGAGWIWNDRSGAAGLRSTGYWTMLLAAIGSVGAVFSGLLMTHGSVAGHGALRWHHAFVWPAFALLVGLATWRTVAGRQASRRQFAVYLAVVVVAAALVSGAGYWGGELLVRGVA